MERCGKGKAMEEYLANFSEAMEEYFANFSEALGLHLDICPGALKFLVMPLLHVSRTIARNQCQSSDTDLRCVKPPLETDLSVVSLKCKIGIPAA